MRSVTDIASERHISRQAVYKQFRKPKFKPFIRVVDGVQYITDEGYAKVYGDMDAQHIEPHATAEPTGAVEDAPTVVKELYEALIQQHKDELKRLYDELDKKNEQISSLSTMLSQEQILHKQLQDQVLLTGPVKEGQQDKAPTLWERITGRR